jgi:excisionase family DNA binding protein
MSTSAGTLTYLSTAEVAEQLQVTPDYVARQCVLGNLRGKRLGHQWRISPEAVAEFMAGDPTPATRVRLSRRQQRQARRASA